MAIKSLSLVALIRLEFMGGVLILFAVIQKIFTGFQTNFSVGIFANQSLPT